MAYQAKGTCVSVEYLVLGMLENNVYLISDGESTMVVDPSCKADAILEALGGRKVDAIVLTAGVGENCEKMRRMIFPGLQPLGIILDEEKNRQRGFEREISADSSQVKIIIIPTNEEYMIARDTYEIVHDQMVGIQP